MGILIDVSRTLGGGHKEKYFCNAIAEGLLQKNIPFAREVYVPLTYGSATVGKYFLDFLVDGKIVIEIKRGKFVSNLVIDQTKQYLSALNIQLGIIACFTYNGVITKRVVNLY